ncbi:MAG TPA: leucine-rich repeat domain-containing protein, partial [Saprospiraceae bacterium]|nr:leucine-rich repeat domain-containing protein [Saprospiraceae bacterium]
MITTITKNTKDKIAYFKSRFENLGYGEGHFVFACHAAFPIAITADLLYQIWANFKNYKDQLGNKKSVDSIAVSDLLLSGLVHTTGNDIFEMDAETRAYLLEQLKQDQRFGEARMKALGTFLYQYIDVVAIGHYPKSFIDAQQWTALASIAPDQAAKQISEALSKQINGDKSEEIIHMRNLLEAYANQDERFESILHYTKGLKAAIFQMPMDVVKAQFDKAQAKILSISDEAANEKGILKIPILKSLKGKIEIEKEVLAPGTDEVLQRIAAMRKNGSTLLDLSRMDLTTIPKEVFELEQLTELDLTGNKITRLPREITQLKKLKKLLLKHNPIAYIDDYLTALTQLEVFKLDKGKLLEFPDVLLKMQSLVNISLEDNQIPFLPPEITLLENLRLLDLRGNPILNLPSRYLKRTINTIHEYFENIKVVPQKHYDPIALVLCPETENNLLERDRIARQLAGAEKYLKIETLSNNTS